MSDEHLIVVLHHMLRRLYIVSGILSDVQMVHVGVVKWNNHCAHERPRMERLGTARALNDVTKHRSGEGNRRSGRSYEKKAYSLTILITAGDSLDGTLF